MISEMLFIRDGVVSAVPFLDLSNWAKIQLWCLRCRAFLGGFYVHNK